MGGGPGVPIKFTINLRYGRKLLDVVIWPSHAEMQQADEDICESTIAMYIPALQSSRTIGTVHLCIEHATVSTLAHESHHVCHMVERYVGRQGWDEEEFDEKMAKVAERMVYGIAKQMLLNHLTLLP